VKFGF